MYIEKCNPNPQTTDKRRVLYTELKPRRLNANARSIFKYGICISIQFYIGSAMSHLPLNIYSAKRSVTTSARVFSISREEPY